MKLWHLSPVLIAVFLFSCKGPLEKELDRSYKSYEKSVSDAVNRQELTEILKKNIRLLSEKTYTDKKDIENKKSIMYRASILLAAAAFHLEEGKEIRETSRSIYMNAYLLDPVNACSDFKALLPFDADTESFEKIKLPDYTTEDVYTEKSENSSSSKKYHLTSKVILEKAPPYYLLQLVGGDILNRAREEKNLASMRLDFYTESGKSITFAVWDSENDTLTVNMME